MFGSGDAETRVQRSLISFNDNNDVAFKHMIEWRGRTKKVTNTGS